MNNNREFLRWARHYIETHSDLHIPTPSLVWEPYFAYGDMFDSRQNLRVVANLWIGYENIIKEYYDLMFNAMEISNKKTNKQPDIYDLIG